MSLSFDITYVPNVNKDTYRKQISLIKYSLFEGGAEFTPAKQKLHHHKAFEGIIITP